MDCERWREMLSAQLDGEDGPDDRVTTEHHLTGCAGCRRWLNAAATANRLTTTGTPTSVPDLSAAIIAALPPPAVPSLAALSAAGAEATPAAGGVSPTRVGPPTRPNAPHTAPASTPRRGASDPRRRSAVALFAALAAVGAVQLILGLTQVRSGADQTHAHAAGLAATPSHLWHESAAWNVAIGAGFLFIALRRIRPTGLVPMLSAFVGMLLLLSVNDLTADRVDATRLVSHGFVIAGYLIVVTLSRIGEEAFPPPGGRLPSDRSPADNRPGNGWRARFDETGPVVPARPGLRLVRRGPATPVTARHNGRRAA